MGEPGEFAKMGMLSLRHVVSTLLKNVAT